MKFEIEKSENTKSILCPTLKDLLTALFPFTPVYLSGHEITV